MNFGFYVMNAYGKLDNLFILKPTHPFICTVLRWAWKLFLIFEGLLYKTYFSDSKGIRNKINVNPLF